MRPKVFSVVGSAGGVSHSPVYVVDHYNDPTSIGLAVTVSGVHTIADVQHTFADPGENNLNAAVSAHAWVNHDTLVSANAANQNGTMVSNYAHPPRAIRLRVRAFSSASAGERATLTIVPAGPM